MGASCDKLSHHKGSISNMIQLSNGNILSSSSEDSKVLEYTYIDGKLTLIDQFLGHDMVSNCLVEIEGYLISSDYSKNLVLFEKSTHKFKSLQPTLQESSTDLVSLLKNGNLFINLCNGKYSMCDLKNNFSVIKNFEKIPDDIKRIFVNQTNSILVYETKKAKENNIGFFDYLKNEVVHELTIKLCMGVTTTSNGNYLFCSLNNLIEIDKNDYSEVRNVKIEGLGLMGKFKELLNGDFVTSNHDGSVLIYDSSLKFKKKIMTQEKFDKDCYSITLQLKDGTLLVGDNKGLISLYDQNYEFKSKTK